MKKLISYAFFYLTFCQLALSQYASQNITLFSNWKDTLMDHTSMYPNYNSIWGYKDQIKNREYAILGGKDGTYFIEVTSTESPQLRDFVPGRRGNCTWREFKSYGKYAYLISDDSAPNSFQIVDMSYLPDSVHVVHDSDSIFVTAHTLYIDGDKLYCAWVLNNQNQRYTIAVYSLANPERPQLLRTLNQDYPSVSNVHDMFVRNDTVYVSAAYQGLYVFKLNSSNVFEMLGSINSYPDAGYNHSSWLSENGKTLVMCDEVPAGLAVKVLNVADLSDISVASTFESDPDATPHNPYVVGNDRVVIAYYEDGVHIYDISKPENPVRTGYFDTHYQNGNGYLAGNAYNGCWGAYPYLPSGIILASDRQNGLFVLNASKALSVPEQKGDSSFFAGPNPFKNELNITLNENIPEADISIIDISGRIVFSKNIILQGQKSFKILPGEISPGIYFLNIRGNEFLKSRKIIKL